MKNLGEAGIFSFSCSHSRVPTVFLTILVYNYLSFKSFVFVLVFNSVQVMNKKQNTANQHLVTQGIVVSVTFAHSRINRGWQNTRGLVNGRTNRLMSVVYCTKEH